MMTYDEVMEAIEKGFIKGDKISIVRRNGKIHDLLCFARRESRTWRNSNRGGFKSCP